MRFLAIVFCVLLLAGCQTSGSAHGSNANVFTNLLTLQF